jgi:hypothetical protein
VITRIDAHGRSAHQTLMDAVNDNPDQAMVLWVKDGVVKVSAGGNDDRLWRMGALSAALIEEWTHDS